MKKEHIEGGKNLSNKENSQERTHTNQIIVRNFAHENAGIKFIFNTLKLMLFLQIYKKGVLFFVETMNYSG